MILPDCQVYELIWKLTPKICGLVPPAKSLLHRNSRRLSVVGQVNEALKIPAEVFAGTVIVPSALVPSWMTNVVIRLAPVLIQAINVAVDVEPGLYVAARHGKYAKVIGVVDVTDT